MYNLPKWLMPIGTFLGSLEGMTFKHWIAVDKAHSLPIPNRLSQPPEPWPFSADPATWPASSRNGRRDSGKASLFRNRLFPKGDDMSKPKSKTIESTVMIDKRTGFDWVSLHFPDGGAAITLAESLTAWPST